MSDHLDDLVAWSGPGEPLRRWTSGAKPEQMQSGLGPALTCFSAPGTSGLRHVDVAVVERGTREILTATVPTYLASGLFWSRDRTSSGQRLLVGRSLGDVVQARNEPTTLDEDFVRAFVRFRPSPRSTPYHEVCRLPPGVTARWQHPDGEPEISVWSGPDVWPGEPDLEGPGVLDAYQEAFDDAVRDLCYGETPLAALMSGGLDSTYLVASLAQVASAVRPVHAFTHAPHPDARLARIGNLDPDESMIASAMQRMYQDRVRVITVINEDLVNPLSAARQIAERCWFPAVNPENEVWISQIEQRSVELGAEQLFSGEQGNYAFSYEPRDAVAHYLAHGDLRAVARLFPRETAQGMTVGAVAYRRYAHPSELILRRGVGRTLAALHLRSRRRDPHLQLLGVPDEEVPNRQERLSGRAAYLRALADCDTSLSAILSPAGRLLPMVDPFRSPQVMRIAASLTSLEWSRGPAPRGFARRLGDGRVPDEIRLRTRSGGQACDTWFAIRHSREEYLDAVAALVGTPILGSWVDSEGISRRVEAWPWGQIKGPDDEELFSIHLILTLADFVRMTARRLQLLPAAAAVPPLRPDR